METLPIGSERQLFVDDFWIDETSGDIERDYTSRCSATIQLRA